MSRQRLAPLHRRPGSARGLPRVNRRPLPPGRFQPQFCTRSQFAVRPISLPILVRGRRGLEVLARRSIGRFGSASLLAASEMRAEGLRLGRLRSLSVVVAMAISAPCSSPLPRSSIARRPRRRSSNVAGLARSTISPRRSTRWSSASARSDPKPRLRASRLLVARIRRRRRNAVQRLRSGRPDCRPPAQSACDVGSDRIGAHRPDPSARRQRANRNAKRSSRSSS